MQQLQELLRYSKTLVFNWVLVCSTGELERVTRFCNGRAVFCLHKTAVNHLQSQVFISYDVIQVIALVIKLIFQIISAVVLRELLVVQRVLVWSAQDCISNIELPQFA